MIVLGLTGSIGMGKSTLAAQFRSLGVPVHDADACVHQSLQPEGAGFAAVSAAFPEAIENGAIAREKLGRLVFADPQKREALEIILHPLVQASEQAFLAQAARENHAVAVLDIPLLFETGAENRVDYVVVATAPAALQEQRVLKRIGMTPEKFNAILALQLPDAEKRQRADFVVSTAIDEADSLRQLTDILHALRNREN